MPGVIHGTASWPGAIAVEACTYTVSHGTTPGTATLRIQPQDIGALAVLGTLAISDGNETIFLPDARLDLVTIEQDEGGQVWTLSIVDRRWRWRDLGFINGCYNQYDPFGKLLPWTIRSPTELAALCLQAMGEANYFLNLPAGINYPGPFVSTPIINTSGVNPPVNWNAVPPAQALQSLADQFGCRVIYQVGADRVLVTPAGEGSDLPPGSIHKAGPTLKNPETPDSVGVIGSPTRFQMRLALEAVGEEWDGSYRPVNQLSYAPPGGSSGQAQASVAVVEFDGTTTAIIYQIFLCAKDGTDVLTGALFEHTSAGGDTAISIAGDLVTQINASTDPRVKGVVKADNGGTSTVTVTAVKVGVPFQFDCKLSGGTPPYPDGNSIVSPYTTPAVAPTPPGQGTWAFCQPPSFAAVRATDRLTYPEAVALAQKSVFRCYRISGVDVSGKGPIRVPVYGPILRRQQIILEDTQAEQITPQPGDTTLTDKDGQPTTVNFYNGYSRDKPAALYGSVAWNEIYNRGGLYYKSTVYPGKNTTPTDLLRVPFTVNALHQLIVSSQYLYYANDDGSISEPSLTLQTAVQIRNSDTNQIEAFRKVVPLPGQNGMTNPKTQVFPDVQLNIIGTYDARGNILGASILEADPINRANTYLEGLAAPYRLSQGITVEYNGIRQIDLDGAIAQVTWSVGPGGASTTASRNCEHDIWIRPYPERRRAEFLPAVERATQTAGRLNMPGNGAMMGG